MAKPGIYDFDLVKGDTFTRTFVCKDGDGNAVNLTSYDVNWTAKFNKSDTTALFDWTSIGGSPEIVVTPSLGMIVVTVTAAATTLLDFDYAYHEMEVTDGTHVHTIMEGRVDLKEKLN